MDRIPDQAKQGHIRDTIHVIMAHTVELGKW